MSGFIKDRATLTDRVHIFLVPVVSFSCIFSVYFSVEVNAHRLIFNNYAHRTNIWHLKSLKWFCLAAAQKSDQLTASTSFSVQRTQPAFKLIPILLGSKIFVYHMTQCDMKVAIRIQLCVHLRARYSSSNYSQTPHCIATEHVSRNQEVQMTVSDAVLIMWSPSAHLPSEPSAPKWIDVVHYTSLLILPLLLLIIVLIHTLRWARRMLFTSVPSIKAGADHSSWDFYYLYC